jgi:hypothetical protein
MRRIFQISSGSAYPVFSFLVLSFARKIHVDNRRDPTQAGSLCYAMIGQIIPKGSPSRPPEYVSVLDPQEFFSQIH